MLATTFGVEMDRQAATLKAIHARNRANAFWSSWAPTGAMTPERMRRAPVTTYESVEPWVRAIRHGEPGAGRAFGPSPVVAIAQTSGTSSEPKRFPLNRDFLKAYQRFMTRLVLGIARGTRWYDVAARGRRLTLTSRPHVARAPCGMTEGSMSGLMALHAPRWSRRSLLPSRDVLGIASWTAKLPPLLEEARHEDVRLVAGTPAMLLAFSERALAYYDVDTLSEVWPNLRTALFGGVAFTDAGRHRLAELWGTRRRGAHAEGDVVIWEMYSATEGMFAHTVRRDVPGMVFDSRLNFYQFRDGGDPRFLHLHELREGGRYHVYVTTPGGLVNYAMNDVIEVTGLRPLSFRVYGRATEELSVVGEMISIGQAREAVERAVSAIGARLHDFTLWVDEGSPSRVVCGMAVDGDAHARATGDLASHLDRALRDVCEAYDEYRIDDFVLGRPRVDLLPSEVFERYQMRHIDEGQFKGRRLFRSEQEFRAAYQPESEEVCRAVG